MKLADDCLWNSQRAAHGRFYYTIEWYARRLSNPTQKLIKHYKVSVESCPSFRLFVTASAIPVTFTISGYLWPSYSLVYFLTLWTAR